MLDTDKALVGCCGFYCGRCVFFCDSEVKKTAKLLQSHLKGYDKYAERMGETEKFSELRAYPMFMKVLNWFADRNCHGCRSGDGFEGCQVITCCLDRGYEFCFQCELFPCEKMHKSMIANSMRIKELGLKEFVVKEKLKIGFE